MVGVAMFFTAVGGAAGWYFGWIEGTRHMADQQRRVRKMLGEQSNYYQSGPVGGGFSSSPTYTATHRANLYKKDRR